MKSRMDSSVKEGKPYQICARCVMDTSDPFIQFNREGYCNHCTEFLSDTRQQVFRGEETVRERERLVQEIKAKGKNSDYDAVLGISGGVDSCYAAYVAKELGLRLLCVHMDNGWNAEEAVKNIRNVVQKLGFDYMSYVLDWEEFRNIQLAVLKSSIVEVEIPTDVAILGALHSVAAKHNVKYIVSGGNFATEGILPESWFYDAKDYKLLKSINRRFGKTQIRKFPHFNYWREIYYKVFKGIRMVYLLNYVPFEKAAAMKLLQDEMAWEYYGGKHYESRFTGFVQSYYQFEKFDVDYRRATLSTQICMDEISRAAALDELKNSPYDPLKIKQEVSFISKKLGVSVDEFMSIMDSPPKSYRDYPNNEKFLKRLYALYHFVKRWL